MIPWNNPSCRRTRTAAWAALVVVAALLGGCKLLKKGPQAAPAPAPVVAAAATEPLSAPQTAERLPPPQPIPPGAVPPEPAAATVEPVPAPPPRPLPKARQAAGPAAAPAPATQAPAAPPFPPPGTAGPPQLRPVFGAGQERDLRDRIDRSLAAAEQYLSRVGAQPSDRRYAAVARVEGFIKQARQARDQGDLNRARSLAERAELLASDLARTSK